MLKKRVIACLLLNDGVLMRTKKFSADYGYTAEFVGNAAADEVFVVDISRRLHDGHGSRIKYEQAVEAYTEQCFTPVALGGWVCGLDDCKRLFGIGADKIVIGRGCHSPFLVQSIAIKYGSQAVVAGVDARTFPDRDLVEVAMQMQDYGAGEIFLQSVERDGSLLGYDLKLLERAARAVRIPVVIGGGVGNWRHMQEAFNAGADGCVTSNIFHMTEASMGGFKQQLDKAGVAVRV